jgi:hypothetical protein
MAIIWGIIFWLDVSGIVNFSYKGFAIDKDGLLYIGKSKGIDIYDNGEFIKTMFPVTGYAFTIQDEKIYLAYSSKLHIYDLTGRLADTLDDSSTREANKLYRERNHFFTDEANYLATNKLGFYQITKIYDNNESQVIYQMPIFDYAIKLLQEGIGIFFVITIAIVLFDSIGSKIKGQATR